MQISYYLLSRSKKPQIQFCFRSISSLRAKSNQSTRFLPRQPHCCSLSTPVPKGKQEWRDRHLQRDHLCPISNPSCTCFDSLPCPPEPSTQLSTTKRWRQLPDFPGIFKTDKNVILLSYSKGINSGTRRGSTAAHARSGIKGEILLQNKKSQNKNKRKYFSEVSKG